MLYDAVGARRFIFSIPAGCWHVAMGLSDRDYYREDDGPSGFSLGGDRSMVANLIILNVLIFVVDQFTYSDGGYWLSSALAMKTGTIARPWDWWRFLTNGFVHSPHGIGHIGFNMLGLYFFGREVEDRLGRFEFLRFYLSAIVFGSVIWSAVEVLRQPQPLVETVSDLFHGFPVLERSCYGASGGVVAVLMLFALNNPHRQVLVFGVLPMPAWLMAALYTLLDVLGAMGKPVLDSGPVAYTAHLGGGAFGFFYHAFGWHLGRFVPSADFFKGWKRNFSRRIQSRPPLKIHTETPDEAEVDEAEVDRILDKINREGSSSLTDAERTTLQNASRRYQRKRR